MATPRTPNQKRQYAKLNARLAKYGKLIERLYEKYNREAANIAMRTDYDPESGKMFRFQDYPQTREAVRELLNEYISELTGTIHRTTSQEWQNSNDFQDLLVNKVLKSYGVKAKDGTVYERYYKTDSDHLKAFQNRTVNGMNLSRRVWNLSQQYKQELEMGMSVGIERGSSAASLAKGLKQYLKDPDRLFRRVRDKYGNLQLSKNAKAYHPGQGVYRSSYKNALRLTRSETNMAYRTAEQNRWRQFDFVVGYEIKLSQSHPCHDVCDTLAGKYPKDFVWTGWHPMDMCYCVSILKSDDEFWRDFGVDNPQPSEKEVTDVPEAFKDWVRDNADRIETAEKRGTQPYFVRDNKDKINNILKLSDITNIASEDATHTPHYGAAMKLGRSATKDARKIVENIGVPELTEVQKTNTRDLAKALGISTKEIKPMSFLDANDGASNPTKDLENCQSVVVAFEARRRGLNVYALPYDSKESSASFLLGERFQDAWLNPKTGKVIEPTIIRGSSDSEIISKLKKQLNADGRYILGINNKDGGGHVVSVDVIKGHAIIKDEQLDEFYKFESFEKISYLEILRIDKAIVNIEKVKSILTF